MSLLHKLDRLIEVFPIPRRFLRFCLVGGSGVFVNLGLLSILLVLLPDSWGSLQHRLAMALAIMVSTETNFLLNNAWTWGDQAHIPKPSSGARTVEFLKKNMKFFLVSSLGGLVQWGVGVLLCERLSIPVLVAQTAGIVAATAINYFLNHLWTFKVGP